MNIDAILNQLRDQLASINEAIHVLELMTAGQKRRRASSEVGLSNQRQGLMPKRRRSAEEASGKTTEER